MNLPLPWTWSWDFGWLVGIGAAALLYVLGLRLAKRVGGLSRIAQWRVTAYYAGLLSVFIAIETPIRVWSQMYLTAHMIQHTLLIFIAAPLIALGAPLLPFWRAMPFAARQENLRWGMSHPRARRVALAVGRSITSPLVVWGVFVGDYYLWHIPPMYDLALANPGLHALEHACFLVTALFFWAEILNSPPFQSRMEPLIRALFLFSAEIVTKALPIGLVIIGTPAYTYYVTHHTPGTPSALSDQVQAAALFGVVAGIVVASALAVLAWQWLDADEANAPIRPPAGYKMRPLAPVVQPTFKGKPLRWTPIVLQGGGTPPRSSSESQPEEGGDTFTGS